MGGTVNRHEPATLALLEQFPEVYQIFQDAGWLQYFQRLGGFSDQEALEFSLNLTTGHSMVAGQRISVTEADIAAVTGLPRTGLRWYNRKASLHTQNDFLLPGEVLTPKGRGMALTSLPEPWGKVAEFIKRYISCEGRYQVAFHSDFVLLAHLRHQKRINLPYFLLQTLHAMEKYTRVSKNKDACVSNHRLIGLLIHRQVPSATTSNPPSESSSRHTARSRTRPPDHSYLSSHTHPLRKTCLTLSPLLLGPELAQNEKPSARAP